MTDSSFRATTLLLAIPMLSCSRLDECVVTAETDQMKAELVVAAARFEQPRLKLRLTSTKQPGVFWETMALEQEQTVELGVCFAELVWSPEQAVVGVVGKLCTNRTFASAYDAVARKHVPWASVERFTMLSIGQRYGLRGSVREWLDQTQPVELGVLQRKMGRRCSPDSKYDVLRR